MTTTATFSTSDSGYVMVAFGAPYPWVPLALPVTVTKFDEVGLTFDFGFSYNNGGILLSPDLPFTHVADPIAGIASRPWTLTITTNLTTRSAIVNIYMVLNPQPWTTANSPYTARAGNLADESILIEKLTTLSSSWVQNANGSTWDLIYEFDFDTLGSAYLGSYTNFPMPASIHPFRDIISQPDWNGLFQFHLDAGGAIAMAITSATFSGEVASFHTGFMDQPMGIRGRAVHCYITGQPYMSHEAVEDGYRDGIKVHPDNYDPADPLDTDYFTPPPGEGVVDDEIPDVE